MYDLASVQLQLLPHKTNTLPLWLGRATHAHFLAAMRRINPALASAVHDSSLAKPFTASNLIGGQVVKDQIHLSPSSKLSLRYTTLHSDLTTIMLNGLMSLWRNEPIVLHDQPFTVHTTRLDNEWSGCNTYHALLNFASETETNIHFVFSSPTAFRGTLGYDIPMPLAGHVFGSLMRRWNSFAPVEFPTEILGIIDEVMVIEAHTIHSEEVRFKKRHRDALGFVGKVTYRIISDDRVLIRYLNALADFAVYSGVGTLTATGLGQVRRVKP